MTSEANIVLSGNSPMKMIGKTATTMAKFTATFLVVEPGGPPGGATWWRSMTTSMARSCCSPRKRRTN